MKVLLISHLPPPTTGIGTWTKRVLQKGLPDGWNIGIVNSNMIGGRDPFRNTRIRLWDEIIRSFTIWKNTEKELRSDPTYQLVHTNIPCTVLGMLRESITALIAKYYHKKFVVYCHCTLPYVENRWHKRLIFSTFSKLVDGYIVLNTQSKKFAQKYTSKSINIIPIFVTEEELSKDDTKELTEKIRNVIFVGGVSSEKGCDTIITAAENMPEITFHLVGIISREIQTMQIPPNVKLYGNQDRGVVQKMLLNCDVFVFLSHYFGEGFSNALLEAMAAGLPCIVTDWAANADMIGQDGGFVIKQQDPSALIDALKRLDNKEMRTKMSQRNFAEVKNNYTAQIVLKKITTFYNEILSSKE